MDKEKFKVEIYKNGLSGYEMSISHNGWQSTIICLYNPKFELEKILEVIQKTLSEME